MVINLAHTNKKETESEQIVGHLSRFCLSCLRTLVLLLQNRIIWLFILSILSYLIKVIPETRRAQ